MLGETLAHYRILEKLGAGGMGEVYRAADDKLGREVAIKVIPRSLAFSEEMLARFEREAKALAAVDHPNIAAIYSFETVEPEPVDEGSSRTVHFLVMQLVEGEALDEIIDRGAIPADRALGIAKQIAGALESAHQKGIIHRDLKPGNVKVDDSGRARVLDFGLAKFLEAAASKVSGGREGGPSHSQSSPTMKVSRITPSSNVEITREGVLLGTVAYMSPEQARGLPADERSDIWAFGCVLYEMLTGKRPFGGTTLSDCIAQIIEREPDLERLPSSVPRSIRTLIRLCLTKDPSHRLHDMADVRLWLERWSEIEPVGATTGPRWRSVLPWLLAVIGFGAFGWVFTRPAEKPEVPDVTRFVLQTEALALGPHPGSSIVALSPDGRTLAYVAGEGAKGQIYLRRLDSIESTPVEGAEMARLPFFSPDGKWLGFEIADETATKYGRLMKVSVEGGKAWPICDARLMHGASWGRDGTIVVGVDDGIGIVQEEGGELELVAEPDPDSGETWLSWPQMLPDSKSVLFTFIDSTGVTSGIELLDLQTRSRRRLLEKGGNPRYLASGHIVYPLDGSLMVVPFDLKNGAITGKPTAVLDGIVMGFPKDPPFAHYAVSENGTLAYVAGPMVAAGNQLMRVARDGSAERIGELASRIFGPRFSPDGRRIAMTATVGDVFARVWIHDLVRGSFTPLTPEQGWWPHWFPNGREIVFTAFTDQQGGQYRLFRIPADGATPPERVDRSDQNLQAVDFSADGKTLIIHWNDHPETGWDIMALDLEEPGRELRPLLATDYNELQAELSPDGRWLAYVSEESGRPQVYVRSYPGLDRRWQISSDGGLEPTWSPDGSELFYRDPEGMQLIAVPVILEPEFQAGNAVVILDGPYVEPIRYGRNYDVAPDGKSFLLVRQDLGGTEHASLQVVLNWDVEVADLLTGESP